MPTLEFKRDRLSTSEKFLKDYICIPTDDINNPTSGGSFKPDLNTLVIPAIKDRILPTVAPQKPLMPAVSTIVFNERSQIHLQLLKKRQQEFNTALGSQSHLEKMVSYNPVMDRVNYEMATSDQQVQAVISDMERELVTNLRERYQTPLSVVTYVLDEQGKAFSEDDPNEPVEDKYKRGAQYRIGHDPREADREMQTVKATMKALDLLADPKVADCSKVVLVSPPGVTKDSIYQGNFVNIFELQKDPLTGKRIIKMYLFASALSNEEYKIVLEKFQPNFFDGKSGSFDVRCLDPIFLDANLDTRDVFQLFGQEFRPQDKTTSEEDFQEIVRQSQSLRQHYIDIVCGKVFNPKQIALVFNALLNKADAIKKMLVRNAKGVIKAVEGFTHKTVNVLTGLKEEVEHWGRQPIDQIMAGCGLSAGFSVGGIAGSVGRLVSGGIGSVGTLVGGLFSKDKDYCIRCGACGEEIRCVVKKGEKCPKCDAVRRC